MREYQNDMEFGLFEKLNLNDKEKEFINNVISASGTQFNDKLQTSYHSLTNLYLAKQIEMCTEKNLKSSNIDNKRIRILTIILIIFSFTQSITFIIHGIIFYFQLKNG